MIDTTKPADKPELPPLPEESKEIPTGKEALKPDQEKRPMRKEEGIACDGMFLKEPNEMEKQTFLTTFKVMDSEGDPEKYMRLQKLGGPTNNANDLLKKGRTLE